MRRKKIFGIGAVVLMILVAVAPSINAIVERTEKENNVLVTSSGGYDLKIDLKTAKPISLKEVKNQEYVYVTYYLTYTITNVGDAVYQDEGSTVLFLMEKGSPIALASWEIENLRVESGQTKSFNKEIEVRSEPFFDDKNNQEARYPLKDLILEIDAGTADLNLQNNRETEFSNIVEFLEKYRPTTSQMQNMFPNEDKIEKYIKVNDKIKIPVFFESYEGAIVKLKSVFESNHAGYVGEAAILLIHIAKDIFAMVSATAAFLVLISDPLVKIVDWLTLVVKFFTYLSDGVFRPDLLKQIIKDLIYKVIPAMNEIMVEAATYSAVMWALANTTKKDIDAFLNWQDQDPWEKPIKLFGECKNIKEGKKVKFYDYKGEFLGESEPANSDKVAKYNLTRVIKENEDAALLHNCRIKAVYGDQTKYSKLIHSWAFSNGSFQWTFKFKDGGSREKMKLMQFPILEIFRGFLNSKPLLKSFPIGCFVNKIK